jgi:saccharopine dehydrogenase (NAD+, L-lysine forming)
MGLWPIFLVWIIGAIYGSEEFMKASKKILIVGGYGEVGRLISAWLAEDYGERLVIAGRNARKAAQLADEIGKGAGSLALDADNPATLAKSVDDVELVINCVDAREPHLARLAATNGMAYLDITAHVPFWRQVLALGEEARHSGARLLLGAGLIPGIANVMARAGAELTGQVESIRTALLLTIGDGFGPAALDYMLSAAAQPFVVRESGREKRVRNFTGGKRLVFPVPLGPRRAYRFGLPGQIFYPQTLGVESAADHLALDPPWVMALCAALARLRLTGVLRNAVVRKGFVRVFAAMGDAYAGRDTYALQVAVKGVQGIARLSLVGRHESAGTAIGAALMARSLLEDDVTQPGAWLSEQVVEPRQFFARLADCGLHLSIEEI